jgi:hypothetical protein
MRTSQSFIPKVKSTWARQVECPPYWSRGSQHGGTKLVWQPHPRFSHQFKLHDRKSLQAGDESRKGGCAANQATVHLLPDHWGPSAAAESQALESLAYHFTGTEMQAWFGQVIRTCWTLIGNGSSQCACVWTTLNDMLSKDAVAGVARRFVGSRSPHPPLIIIEWLPSCPESKLRH